MIVHADEAGNDGAGGEVQGFRAVGNSRGCRVSHRSDFSIFDQQCLVCSRGGAGSVDHADVRERDFRRVFAHERAHTRRELRGGLRPNKGRQQDET